MPVATENLTQNYLRHPNGGGKIFDNSEADFLSFVDRASVVRGASSVWTSEIFSSQIISSTLVNACIENSWVENTLVAGGSIESSIVNAEIITGRARVRNCEILGASRVAHNAYLEKVKIKDLTVSGSARLEGDWEMDGCFGYISRGVWERPPRVVRLPFEVTVTESVLGFAFVACREYSIEKWLKCGERYGKARGWSPEQIDRVRQIFLNWQRT